MVIDDPRCMYGQKNLFILRFKDNNQGVEPFFMVRVAMCIIKKRYFTSATKLVIMKDKKVVEMDNSH